MSGRRILQRVPRSAAAATAALLSLGACGSGDDDDVRDAQPSPGVSTFEGGALEELPLLPRSEPFGRPSELRDVTTRTYKTTGTTPEGVIDFYADRLAAEGWTRTEPVHREDGPGRADFVKDGRRLEVSATSVDEEPAAGSEKAVVQYSLTLRPQ